ncbi:MAG: MFS transporter [Pseudonocardia sp.]|uniref:MFS transporter n=1 Tax=unclassified Pseudonocardia TaxID=2619320 RepID=UPI00086D3211|nr:MULTISPECIES: MFS transporter [unclassified Pseudonocardia]MBN9111279.1 MFS transporter [Pseudonocardia sp.]ODU24445.1 MAG: permease [Pseudonocardia sp. SCN 72-51]ODV06273.1 MAG: permease [Pseudonocardia sp. SCN 73-27]
MSDTSGGAVDPDVPDGAARLRLLQLSALTSTVDRFAIAPLLVEIARGFDASLVAVAGVASGYFLAYGLMQLVWGLLSDRLGRVRVMRVALAGLAVAGLASVLAPNLAVLAVSRVVAGGTAAALIPTTLVYVGATWPIAVRQRPLSDLLAASAVGTAVATIGAGLVAELVGWRAVFGLTGAAAVVLWWALRRLPEPDRPDPGPPLRPLKLVVRSGWAWVVLTLALVEGAVALGTLTYLAPSLQDQGWSPAVAGLVAAGYGIGALATSRVVRRLVGRVPPAGLAAVGGAVLAVTWVPTTISVTVVTVLASGLLLGIAWAFLHTTLQTWATEVVPQARAAAVALFVTVLFLGSSVGTAVVAPLADAGAFGTVFTIALVVSVPLAVVAVIARARYARVA